MFCRHYQLAIHHILLEHRPGAIGHRSPRRGRKVVAIGLDSRENMLHVRLLERLAVQVHHLVDDADMIARHADYAFHVVLLDVHRVAEHDDVASLGLGIREEMASERARRRIR